MKSFDVAELQVPCMFTEAVYLRGKVLLLPAQVPFTRIEKNQVLRWNIDQIFSVGKILGPDETRKFMAGGGGSSGLLDVSVQLFTGDLLKKTTKQTEEWRARLARLLQMIGSGAMTNFTPIFEYVQDVLPVVRAHPEAYLLQALAAKDFTERDPIASHSLNVFIIASCVIHELNLAREKELAILCSAVMIDVGMLKIPKALRLYSESLMPEEFQQIKTHTVLGAKLLQKIDGTPRVVPRTALDHHERFNGTGYPRGLSEKKIGFSARFLAIADVLESMTQRRRFRESLAGYQAFRKILQESREMFDPELLKCYLRQLSLYPPGCRVRLNNQQIGFVIRQHPDALKQPLIQLVSVDPEGEQRLGEELDLRTSPLTIIGVLPREAIDLEKLKL